MIDSCFQICQSKLEDLVDHVLTTGSAHDYLGVSTVSKLSVCLGLVHLVVVLSLGVDGCQVLLLGRALLLQGHVLCLHVGELGVLVDTHDLGLLLGINQEGLCLSLGFVDLLDGLSLHLLHNDIPVTLSIDDLLVGLGLRVRDHLLVDRLRLLLGLGLLDDCTLDLLLQQVILSPVLVLEQRQLLLLFVFEGKLQVLLFLLMILEFDLEPGLLGECADELWVDEDAGHIALLKGDTVFVELGVQLLHHILSHI